MPKVKCPNCRKETEYSTANEFRPFCSERCKLLDFGAWANEEFALPTQETSLSEEDFEKIERALQEKEKL
ncbi:DNA gyrase inhibitor YacG [soil metagenome]